MNDMSSTPSVRQNGVSTESPSLLVCMADRYGMRPDAFEKTLRATVVPANCSKEQFAAFLLVSKEYGLNPVLREIYAMPAKSGGIQPIVSIDGWLNIINSNPKMDGLEFEDHLDESGKLVSITARIWRKDREKPIEVTEYMSECRRDTPTWKQWPARMLRHKAAIQCARYAFGFAGIIDPDEYERMESAAAAARPGPPPAPQTVPSAPAPARKGPPPAPKSPPPKAPDVEAIEDAEIITDDGLSDPISYLSHLSEQMCEATTQEEFEEVWSAHKDVAPRLSEEHQKQAREMWRHHQQRLMG